MWKRITDYAPPVNQAILTRIDDSIGIRNEQKLTFDGKRWWTPDGKLYVYYTPTHFFMTKTGIEIIAEERQRQIEVEGWTADHDDRQGESLAMAAGCYAMPDHYREVHDDRVSYIPYYWPHNWPDEMWKPTPDDRVRELAKAGALIAAAIDQINRLKVK